MTQPVVTVLLVLVVLEVKHFIFDYPLQTAYQLKNKVIYGHPGGLLHAGLHMIGSTPVFLLVAPSLAVALAIMGGEFVAHYHIDWAKGQFTIRNQLTTNDSVYWWAIGADQLLHHLTYVAIAAVLVQGVA